MKRRTMWAWIVVCLMGCVTMVNASEIVYKGGQAVITLEDHIDHPLYWWPKTLLSYSVEFREKVDLSLLVLTNHNGEQLPFQLTNLTTTSDGKQQAVLHLLSDLPSKGAHRFTLRIGTPKTFPMVKTIEEGGCVIVSTENYSIRIPASQSGATIPAPIQGVSRNGTEWMGQSTFSENSPRVKELKTEQITLGALFAQYRLTYNFDNGASYEVVLRCVEGYEFVEMDERMQGFNPGGAAWNIHWTHFSPTHRQAPNHPYQNHNEKMKATPGFGRYNWERIDQNFLNSHHGLVKNDYPDGRLPFELAIFGNWPAEKYVTSSLFWDEKSNQSVGVFVEDISKWDNNRYDIWHSGRVLNVKFYYKNGQLRWEYPLSTGRRTTALSLYPHQKDIDYLDRIEALTKPTSTDDGHTYQIKMGQMSYNSFLQNRYSTLDLNRVKGWILNYPDSIVTQDGLFKEAPRNIKPHDFIKNFVYGGFSNELAVSGPCQNSGYGPTSTRSFYEHLTSDLEIVLPQMTPRQRKQAISMFLVHTYISFGEEFMPMIPMLSGHPNFLSDVKAIPAYAAYLFPHHPHAKAWADMFEKFNALNTHYHTRPAVKAWDALGGRWTESTSTYFWGNFKAPQRASYLLQHGFDGKNRMVNPEYEMIANYAVNAISAPFNGEDPTFYYNDKGQQQMHAWGQVSKTNAPQRIYPPQGAHAIRRMPPSGFWLMGKYLEYYSPLLSENIRYLARPDFEDAEMLDRDRNPFNRFIYPRNSNDSGTPPDLKSVKITGYGIVLRAAVGTPDELSIHLQQIDEGPNYRWGMANDGGCGNIYFYAQGKSYSNNGKEDAGDRRLQDSDLNTNFGVYRNGAFTSIGMNDLTSPLYNLCTGQFAEITSSKARGYSSPEYVSRSIMLVGADYFMLFDDVFTQNMSTRLSWFTHPNDDLPQLTVVKAGMADYNFKPGPPERIDIASPQSKGVSFDGTGDFLTFVSHKKSFTPTATDYGCEVTSTNGLTRDLIFRSDSPIETSLPGALFAGTAGFIRNHTNGKPQELALFHGNRIGNDEVELMTTSNNVGVSMIYHSKEKMQGRFYSLKDDTVTFRWKNGVPPSLFLYIDGVKQPLTVKGNEVAACFARGNHLWNISCGKAALIQPEISHSLYRAGGAELFISPVAGAEQYRFEYSTNQGKSWTMSQTTKQPSARFRGYNGELKGYVRVTALNNEFQSTPSAIYPLYFTNEKPHYPDGLRLSMETDRVELSWGRVLGCNRYILYRKAAGGAYRQVYAGSKNSFTDIPVKPGEVVEYAVTSSNGNGESSKSVAVSTSPDSWLNFVPIKGEPFRRKLNYDTEVLQTSPMYYPQ